jgi:DNA-binding SARP family transcriptional activator
MDGNLVEAHACLKRAEVHIRANHSNYECGLYQYELGQILCSEGAFQEAAPHLAQAANQLGQSQQLIETIRAQIALASAYHALGETDKALLALKQALQASSGMERLSPLIAVSLSSEHLLGQLQGDPEVGAQATRLLGLIGQNASRITTLLRRLRDETLTLSFTGPKLVVRALGQMQVWLCQKLLTEWEAQTARDLLFCLLAHPNGLTKDEIGALLWPDCSPGQLKVRFKKNIYRLRRAAGEDSIIFEQERYAFNWRLDYDYDVETFRRKLDQAQSESAPDQRARLWREAVELYGGPYLPDLDGTWVWPERERLWQAYVAATLALASYYLENGQPQLALEHCNKIIHTDPLIEDAHRYAMRVHAATGNRAGVIRQYELCQQTLAEELGAAPSSQTNLLYKTLIK